MSRSINIVLITILVCVSAWSIYTANWNILITNVSIIAGVLIDDLCGKLLMKPDVNFILIGRLRKILVPILYIIGALSLILYGYKMWLNPI
ncbi:MAG: hypothetical protein LBO69_07740 [Ignavibacteria bacterium]|nr:hypothetical protein [Ignavibacteria bacterium]